MLINKKDLVLIVQKCLKEEKENNLPNIKYVGEFKSKEGDGIFDHNRKVKYEKFKTKSLAIALDEKGQIYTRTIGSKKYKKTEDAKALNVISNFLLSNSKSKKLTIVRKNRKILEKDIQNRVGSFSILDFDSDNFEFKKIKEYTDNKKYIGDIYRYSGQGLILEFLHTKNTYDGIPEPKSKEKKYEWSKKIKDDWDLGIPPAFDQTKFTPKIIQSAIQNAFQEFGNYIFQAYSEREGSLDESEIYKINNFLMKTKFMFWIYGRTPSRSCHRLIKKTNTSNIYIDKSENTIDDLNSVILHELRHSHQDIGLGIDALPRQENEYGLYKKYTKQYLIKNLDDDRKNDEPGFLKGLEDIKKHQLKFDKKLITSLFNLGNDLYDQVAPYLKPIEDQRNKKQIQNIKRKHRQFKTINQVFPAVDSIYKKGNLTHMWNDQHFTLSIRVLYKAVDYMLGGESDKSDAAYRKAFNKLLSFKASRKLYNDSDLVRCILGLDPFEIKHNVAQLVPLKIHADTKPKVKGEYQIPIKLVKMDKKVTGEPPDKSGGKGQQNLFV